MGLDWNPGNKAKPGHEAEFRDLFRRILAKEPGGLIERFHEISTTVEHRVDVAHSAGRWCVFWAERGHFLDAGW